MHKPLVLTPKYMAVPCISKRCLPSCFINEVDIITSELVLYGFVVCLDTGGGGREIMVTSWGMIASSPYTKKKDISPVAQLEDVRLAHSAHGSSSIHLVPSFFKQS
jgi:hypothetical protein